MAIGWGVELERPLPLEQIISCSVCYGDPNSDMAQGAVMGVAVLLAITAVVLGGFVGLILKLRARAKKFSTEPLG